MELPEKYLLKMQELLKDDYPAYLASLKQPVNRGLRVNTSKISIEEFLRISPFHLTPIPWCHDGFYYAQEDDPSHHPFYYAGMYYLQDASAMAPAEMLDIQKGDLVLDGCCAPGGKALKLAGKLQESGLLVANDISFSRQKATLRNLERAGFTNTCIISGQLSDLSDSYDKILLDVPCSGLGILARRPDLRQKRKTKRSIRHFPQMQKDLLEQAALPEDIIRLGADGVNKIWREAKLRGVGYSKALKIVSTAEHSIGRTEGLDAARSEIQWILENLKTLVKWENDLLEKMESLAKEIPYVDKMLAIKGLGMRTVVGIFAEIGDITRFESVKPIQKLAGLALVEDSSGKHEGKTVISKRGRKRLRYHLYQAGLVLIAQNDEFREVYDYYRTRDENPLKKMQALMAVSCKLLRVLYAMATKGITYDPEKLLGDIRRPQKKAA